MDFNLQKTIYKSPVWFWIKPWAKLSTTLFPAFRGEIAVGSRVRVPLRTRVVLGTVVVADFPLPPRHTNFEKLPPLSKRNPKSHLSSPYFSPWPIGWQITTAARAKLPCAVSYQKSFAKRRCSINNVNNYEVLRTLSSEELQQLERRSSNQAKVIQQLQQADGAVEIASLNHLRTTIKALERKGFVRIHSEKILRDPETEQFLAHQALELNDEQRCSVDTICHAIENPKQQNPSYFTE